MLRVVVMGISLVMHATVPCMENQTAFLHALIRAIIVSVPLSHTMKMVRLSIAALIKDCSMMYVMQ
jgi:hypothetical protein